VRGRTWLLAGLGGVAALALADMLRGDEAVTVHDARGRIEYANDAAARLLRLPEVRAALTAQPGDWPRFEISHPDGRPLRPDELPGARVIRGESPEPLLARSSTARPASRTSGGRSAR